MFSDLGIVIVNLDLKEITRACIHSLLISGADLRQIILVDNGSQDNSVEFLREQFGPDMSIVQVEKNLGYAHGLNLGIPMALQNGAKWLLLMNNDVEVAEDFFSELEKATHSPFAIISPLILYYDLPNQIWYGGDLLIPGTLIGLRLHKNKDVRSLRLPDLQKVDFAHGCAMLVRCDVIEKIGLFNDSSVIYAEEVDFIWRARQAGFKVAVANRARMWHKISALMGKQKPRQRFLRVRNQIRFYRRFSSPIQFPIMFVFSLFRTLWISADDIWRKQTDLLSPLWKAWQLGWFSDKLNDLDASQW